MSGTPPFGEMALDDWKQLLLAGLILSKEGALFNSEQAVTQLTLGLPKENPGAPVTQADTGQQWLAAMQLRTGTIYRGFTRTLTSFVCSFRGAPYKWTFMLGMSYYVVRRLLPTAVRTFQASIHKSRIFILDLRAQLLAFSAIQLNSHHTLKNALEKTDFSWTRPHTNSPHTHFASHHHRAFVEQLIYDICQSCGYEPFDESKAKRSTHVKGSTRHYFATDSSKPATFADLRTLVSQYLFGYADCLMTFIDVASHAQGKLTAALTRGTPCLLYTTLPSQASGYWEHEQYYRFTMDGLRLHVQGGGNYTEKPIDFSQDTYSITDGTFTTIVRCDAVRLNELKIVVLLVPITKYRNLTLALLHDPLDPGTLEFPIFDPLVPRIDTSDQLVHFAVVHDRPANRVSVSLVGPEHFTPAVLTNTQYSAVEALHLKYLTSGRQSGWQTTRILGPLPKTTSGAQREARDLSISILEHYVNSRALGISKPAIVVEPLYATQIIQPPVRFDNEHKPQLVKFMQALDPRSWNPASCRSNETTVEGFEQRIKKPQLAARSWSRRATTHCTYFIKRLAEDLTDNGAQLLFPLTFEELAAMADNPVKMKKILDQVESHRPGELTKTTIFPKGEASKWGGTFMRTIASGRGGSQVISQLFGVALSMRLKMKGYSYSLPPYLLHDKIQANTVDAIAVVCTDRKLADGNCNQGCRDMHHLLYRTLFEEFLNSLMMDVEDITQHRRKALIHNYLAETSYVANFGPCVLSGSGDTTASQTVTGMMIAFLTYKLLQSKKFPISDEEAYLRAVSSEPISGDDSNFIIKEQDLHDVPALVTAVRQAGRETSQTIEIDAVCTAYGTPGQVITVPDGKGNPDLHLPVTRYFQFLSRYYVMGGEYSLADHKRFFSKIHWSVLRAAPRGFSQEELNRIFLNEKARACLALGQPGLPLYDFGAYALEYSALHAPRTLIGREGHVGDSWFAKLANKIRPDGSNHSGFPTPIAPSAWMLSVFDETYPQFDVDLFRCCIEQGVDPLKFPEMVSPYDPDIPTFKAARLIEGQLVGTPEQEYAALVSTVSHSSSETHVTASEGSIDTEITSVKSEVRVPKRRGQKGKQIAREGAHPRAKQP